VSGAQISIAPPPPLPLPLPPAVSAATVVPAPAVSAALQPLIPAPSAAAVLPLPDASAAAPPPLGLDPSAAVGADLSGAEVSGAEVSGPPAELDPEEVIFNTYMLLQKISQQIDGIVSRDSSTLQQYIGNTVFTLNTKLDSLATMVAGIPTATSTAYGEGQTGGKRRGTQKKRK